MTSDSGSFRDPAGHVFTRNGRIYRSIFEPGVNDFEAARDAGIHEKLIDAGLLIHHEEIEEKDAPSGTVYCLRHPRIPMISYPWEWPFSLLKDAALLHLDIMERIVPEGFWLRDASAFNVQYDGNGLRLIDTLSIGKRLPESPWIAYKQFCSHFVAPLALAAYGDIRTLSLWRSYIDGYPLDLAAKMIPLRRRFAPGLFMHLLLHARFQAKADRKENIGKADQAKTLTLSDNGLIALIRSLRQTVSGIRWKRSSAIWEGYGDIRTYDSEDLARKAAYVEQVVKQLNPAMVWDLGANTGEFSEITASGGAFVVSIDGDPACAEFLYEKVSNSKGMKNILPLVMDLANPSPGLGWDGRERFSLRDRGPADLVLALALIHHLVLSSCVPLEIVSRWFSGIGENVLVEFVPLGDPMVQKLLHNRVDERHPYDEAAFRSNFETMFRFVDSTTLENGRKLFLYRRKG
ncbi:MAG: SAM-dependent methyltransferase [Deltaproteobacteria bacterium]|nr:SAM-dependent methyltransferase [Deltaproteobacteria bacterium]